MSTEYQDESGISPVVGVILMVAIAVALAAVVGLVVFDIGSNQDSNVNAGVEVNETEQGVEVRWLSAGNADEIKVLVNGSELDQLSRPGESTTVTAGEGDTVSAVGIEGDVESVLTQIETEKDTTGGSGTPEVAFTGNPFIITVDTTNTDSNTTADNEFKINTGDAAYTYDYSVSTDGTVTNSASELEDVSGDLTLQFDSPGTYQVEISGQLPHLSYPNYYDDAHKIESIDQWGDIKWKNMSYMFTDSVNLTANYSDTPNTSNVTSTAYMFDYSSFNGDVSDWDTGSVTNMSYMFSNTSNFNNGGEPLDWSDTSNVTTMESMFDYASAFNQDVSDWDTGSVTSMYYMFSSASAFNNGGEPLDWSDTSNVTEAGTMFDYASSFNQDVSSWDVSSMQNMDYMFNSASAFNNGGEPLDWNAESALSARSFLSGTSFSEDNSGMCTPYVKSAVNYASGTPIENDDSKLPDFGAPCNPGTVSSTSDPFIITIDTTTNGSTADNEFRINTGYDTFNYDYNVSTDGTVTNAASELQNVNGDLVLEFDSSGVYQVEITGKLPHLKYDKTLDDARKIESIDQWGGMQWQSMDYMFYEGLNINANYSDQPNTSNVTSMYATFGEAYRFNGDLSGIDTSNVVDMRKTFLNSLDFNQNINSWDTGNVKLMNETFKNTNSFNQDLSNWDTSNVTTMRSMFNGASAFNQDISSWNTSNVTNMDRLFKDATSFNQDISPWCVSQISFEPYDFDAGAGFDGDTAKQPDWGNTC